MIKKKLFFISCLTILLTAHLLGSAKDGTENASTAADFATALSTPGAPNICASEAKRAKEKNDGINSAFEDLKKLFESYPKETNIFELSFPGKDDFLMQLDHNANLLSALATPQATQYFHRTTLLYGLTGAFKKRGWKPASLFPK